MSEKPSRRDRARSAYAASNSFDRDELKSFVSICETALRGGDIRVLLRQPAFAEVYNKVRRMLERVEQNVVIDELKRLQPPVGIKGCPHVFHDGKLCCRPVGHKEIHLPDLSESAACG